ncbi:YjgP/YjgQ family permease [bacterium]|jgi:lipopolysaccharide export system permease protein|nr:YjgP/YjgQ family permease [bacterium]
MGHALKAAIHAKSVIIDRYVFTQFLGPFILAIGGFVIIGIVDILFALVDMFVNSGVPLLVVMRLLLYKIPAIMVLFFPMAVLFAVMLLMVRMAKDNEITILRTSGLNLSRLLAPILLICALSAVLSYLTNERLVPWANQVSDTLIRRSFQKRPPPTIVDNVFFKESGDRFFYIRSVDSKKSIMKDILIFEKATVYPRITTAKKATWQHRTWTLFDGKIQEFGADGDLEFSSVFHHTKIHVDRDVQSFYTKRKTPKEMDSFELKEKITVLEKGGINTRSLEVEYHMKKSIPAACLIFGILGVGFCLRFVKSGKDWWGVIIAIVLVVLLVGFYFFLTALFRSLGKKGVIIPILGAWGPNIIYAIPGVGLIYHECIHR